MQKELWVRTDVPDDKDKRKELLLSALEAGISTALIRSEDVDLAELGKITTHMISEGKISDGFELVKIKTPNDQDYAFSLVDKCEGVILDASDWAVIPLENLIAKFRGSRTKVFACASTVEQAKLYMQTLETGVDGIVIDTEDGNIIRKFAETISEEEPVDLVPIEVVDVKNIEMGDRVCIDTVSLMVPGEGMLIGSSASCLFLVQSESEEHGYVAARPFRVNAGAVHAYGLGPGGRTRYLSELKAGEPVLLTDRYGKCRITSVGRCKVEQRPLLLVTATDGEKTYTTILQNAETVRLVGTEGSISVATLKKGDKVLARLETGGRHFGMKIDETITEI
jgi:3-dehydroquinate synthase II